MSSSQNDSGKKVEITLEESEATQARDIVISYSTEQIREPTITLHASDKHPDEIAAHISCIPRVSDEHQNQEDEELKENEETEEFENLVSEIDNQDDPDMASGEFIFILDRSGSMG